MTDSPVNTKLQPFFQLFLRRPSDLDREDSKGEKIQEYLGEDTGTEGEKTESLHSPVSSGKTPLGMFLGWDLVKTYLQMSSGK